MTFSFGIYLPTAEEDKGLATGDGAFADTYDMWAMMPNTLTIRGNMALRQISPDGPFFEIELGPDVLSIDDGIDNEVELFMHYGLSSGIATGMFMLRAELLALFIVTEDVQDFADRFLNTVAFGAMLTSYKIRPGLFYQKPLDDELDFIDGIFGVKLEIVE